MNARMAPARIGIPSRTTAPAAVRGRLAVVAEPVADDGQEVAEGEPAAADPGLRHGAVALAVAVDQAAYQDDPSGLLHRRVEGTATGESGIRTSLALTLVEYSHGLFTHRLGPDGPLGPTSTAAWRIQTAVLLRCLVAQ